VTFSDPFGLLECEKPGTCTQADVGPRPTPVGRTVVTSFSLIAGVVQAAGFTAGIARNGDQAAVFVNFDAGIGVGLSAGGQVGRYNGTIEQSVTGSLAALGEPPLWSSKNTTSTAGSLRGTGLGVSRQSPNADGAGDGWAAGFGAGFSLTATQPHTLGIIKWNAAEGVPSYQCAKVGTGCR